MYICKHNHKRILKQIYKNKNTMQILKVEIIEKLRTNSKARYRLCYEFNSHMNRINRMIESNDVILTTPAALNAISEELEVKKSELLTDK